MWMAFVRNRNCNFQNVVILLAQVRNDDEEFYEDYDQDALQAVSSHDHMWCNRAIIRNLIARGLVGADLVGDLGY